MAAETQRVAIEALDSGEFQEEARQRLSDALGVEVRPPDDVGIAEVEVEAASREEALQIVLDAIAEAGADGHFVIAEHD